MRWWFAVTVKHDRTLAMEMNNFQHLHTSPNEQFSASSHISILECYRYLHCIDHVSLQMPANCCQLQLNDWSQIDKKTLSIWPMPLVDLGKKLLEAAKLRQIEAVQILLLNGASLTADWVYTARSLFHRLNRAPPVVNILLTHQSCKNKAVKKICRSAPKNHRRSYICSINDA